MIKLYQYSKYYPLGGGYMLWWIVGLLLFIIILLLVMIVFSTVYITMQLHIDNDN